MGNISYLVKLPKDWEIQSTSFKELIASANNNIKQSVTEAVDLIYELIFGMLEYLEEDATQLAKTERIFNNPRVKSYEDQLASLVYNLELICHENPQLAPDRYVLYLEIFKKLLYVNLDAISFFIRILHLIQGKINVKKVNPKYLDEYAIFSTEIALIASQDKKKSILSLEILQELTKIIAASHSNSIDLIYPFICYGIFNELRGQFNVAVNSYNEALTRINAFIKTNRFDELPLQLIHEVVFFGYVNSILGTHYEKHGSQNEFYSFINLLDENIANLLRAVHSMVFFGYKISDAFSHISEIRSPVDTIDFYLRSSSVKSRQPNNSFWLEHMPAKQYLAIIESKAEKKGALAGIVIVETKNLKGIQVYSGKNKFLPSLNVFPGQYSNYVLIDEVRFNVSHQFAFGKSFKEDIEIHVNFENKTVLKKKYHVRDKKPPFFRLDLTTELEEIINLKQGGYKKFGLVWTDQISLVDIIKQLIKLDVGYYTFGGESQIKDFLKDLVQIFKKINNRECEQVIQEMLKQHSTLTLQGPSLKLVILQRIASLEPTNIEIETLIKNSI